MQILFAFKRQEPELHTGLNAAQPRMRNIGHPHRLVGITPVRRKCMTRFKIIGAAAILASALASPAMAQQVIYNPGDCAQFYPNANCQNRGPGSPYYGGSYQGQAYRDQAYQDRAWRDSYNRRDDNDSFWPGDGAAGVVGGAVGT